MLPARGGCPESESPLCLNKDFYRLNDVAKSSVVLDREVEKEKSREPSDPRIRCPLCGWTPRKEDRWSCDCGHEWKTFDTGGVCPACLHHWASTQCLSCRVVATLGLVRTVSRDKCLLTDLCAQTP